ncbi:putative baseplate assembly protein [Streptomyces macrosporus]|uniref:LysM domain-containing protein n=1 Tax=Streptomyces macrosporus TaxID=44032 RepID=A0ABN3JKT7_9ACTN
MTGERNRGGCSCGCGGGRSHDERRAPRALHNPPGRSALDYRVGEYGSFLAAMLDRLASPAHPALRGLTARTPDDPSIALLDAWAVLGDLLTFHSERIADEGYLRTADDHRSLVRLGRLVGYRPRPGIAADTHLAYTVDRDPRSREDVPVTIPRGSRSLSVPASSEEEAQTFETTEDLTARWSWNHLAVRRRRPAPLTFEDLRERSEVYVAGTANALSVGDRLLFVFSGDGSGAPGQRLLLPVTRVRIDRDDDSTALGLPVSPPPTLAELIEELERWITPAADGPHPRPVGSRLVEEFDEQVLTRLRADLDLLDTPEAFARRLAEPLERLEEARALAEPYASVAAWFERLAAVLVDLRERAALLGPLLPDGTGTAVGHRATESGHPATRALAALLPALRGRGTRRPPVTGAAPPDPARLFGPDSDLGARLLSALDPSVSGELRTAWRQVAAPTAPPALTDLLAMRVTAAPFGSTAPLKPVQDQYGRVIRQSDWPLTGAVLTTMRVVFDTAGKVPVRAEFVHAEPTATVQRGENLPADTEFELGPGTVALSTHTGQDDDPSRLRRRPMDSREPGVTAELGADLPQLRLFVSRPGADGRVRVVVEGGGDPRQWSLGPGDRDQTAYGTYEVTVAYTTGGEPTNVEIGVATVPGPVHRNVLALDTVHEAITVGSWVAIERPRKGAEGGIPGDRALALVTTRVTAVRTGSHTRYGITGRGTELTLADPWLDEHDVLLSHIRDATVHAAGEALRPADEPLADDVGGNEIELAELYDGLRPGRRLIFSGERTDIPNTSGVRGTELAVIAAVEQRFDPRLPGDHVHTVLTLTADLAHRYRRETLTVHGNVVPATHGESRDEAIGSGDASRPNQTFTLWHAPLTWLPADHRPPVSGRGHLHGAEPALEVRVDGLLWHPVDSLAGRGPHERVYVIGTDADGRTTVTFGDGVHGARLPTGHENVRARYRFGTGGAANVAAGRVTQAVTRPLGVTAVTNPLPATGGSEADGPESTRRDIPLAVSALDRLVSVRDYEDFARSRAGIGRASAREVYDGRRRVLHVTVAGADDVPIDEGSGALRSLRASLAAHGDPRLPVRVDVREPVLLLLAARIKPARDHSWADVEPRVRRALLREMGFAGRELGQPARLSEVLATAHSVPGVEYVDVDVFTGVPASATPYDPERLPAGADGPRAVVPARLAEYDERVHTVIADEGETLGEIAARHGITLAELLRLNPDITDTRPLPKGRSVFVFRGIRPAQLVLFAPEPADTLILTEATR